MSITLDEAKKHLATWLEADLAVASNQSYMIGTRRLSRADAEVITSKINYWRKEVARLSKRRKRVRQIIPR